MLTAEETPRSTKVAADAARQRRRHRQRHFVVPSLAGSILRKVIDQLTAPRRGRLGAGDAQAGPTGRLLDRAQRAGQAFTELLEHLPTDRLHGKVAATVVVTIAHEKLLGALGAAGSTPATRSAPVRPAASPAARDCCRPSWVAPRRSWTPAAPNACSPRPSGRCWPPSTPRAPPTAATGRSPGASCTTRSPGHTADAPTSPTPCRCAGSTTAASTTAGTPTPTESDGAITFRLRR